MRSCFTFFEPAFLGAFGHYLFLKAGLNMLAILYIPETGVLTIDPIKNINILFQNAYYCW
jgi:hypothetical protein